MAGDSVTSRLIIDIDWRWRQMQAECRSTGPLQATLHQVPLGPISDGATEQSVHLSHRVVWQLAERHSIGHKSSSGQALKRLLLSSHWEHKWFSSMRYLRQWKKKNCTLYIPLTHTLFHHKFKRSKSGGETKAAERFAILMSTRNGPLIASGWTVKSIFLK